MKKCSKCQIKKDLTQFSNNKSKKDGKATECKTCKAQQDKQYRENNEISCKAYQNKYWTDNRAELYEKKKEYIVQNKVAHLTRQHTWYEKNKDAIKARTSQYKKDHPKQYQMYNNRRLASKKNGIIEDFTIKDIIEKYGDSCVYCQSSFEHIDHYVPLSKGGSHTLDNVRPSCEQCNLEKSNKLPEEFMRYKGISNE